MISIIIPTFNEEDIISNTVRHLLNDTDSAFIEDIIVVDGWSSDQTLINAKSAGARAVLSAEKGRARQMNYGASLAKAPILYFLHADSHPPVGFSLEIIWQVKHGYKSGCYRLAFDYNHWFLNLNCWFTRFNINAVRFGDQSLFVTSEAFKKAGGFNEKLVVMEDQEIVYRLCKYSSFKVLKGTVRTSARKYINNGIYRMQGIFFLIYFMYQLGFSQQKLVSTYRRLINQDKV
jgi:rSAM/selenodomain-associated transferase 2